MREQDGNGTQEYNINYAYPVSALLLAFLFGGIGLCMGITIEPQWFSRFGALVVLCGVVAEYRLVKIEMDNIYDVVEKRSGRWNDDHWGLELPKPNKVLSWTAHLIVGVGTVIWGFGDFFLVYFQC